MADAADAFSKQLPKQLKVGPKQLNVGPKQLKITKMRKYNKFIIIAVRLTQKANLYMIVFNVGPML